MNDIVKAAGSELTSPRPDISSEIWTTSYNLLSPASTLLDHLNQQPSATGDLFIVSGQYGTPERVIRQIPVEALEVAASYIVERSREIGRTGAMEVFVKQDAPFARTASGAYPDGAFFNISAMWHWNSGPSGLSEPPFRLHDAKKLVETIEGLVRQRVCGQNQLPQIAHDKK